MNKIVIIGNFGKPGKVDGQIMKTRMVFNSIKKRYSDNYSIVKLDTSNKNILLYFRAIKEIINAYRIIILPAYSALKPLLFLINFLRASNKTIHIAIGGWLDNYLDKKKWVKKENKLIAVLVQMQSLKNSLEKIGLKNVVYFPNFFIAPGLCYNNKDTIQNSKNDKKKCLNIDDSVTVLITTYNENKEIFSKALESILIQTYKNIKVLIIIDNKDNKDLIELIKKYQKNDNRVSYIINEQNLGLAESLNKGIENIDTKYIARMDADDMAFENRIEKQLEFAKANPQIDLFGANVRYIDYEGNVLYDRKKHDMNIEKIRKIVKFINVFSHPTFFGKMEIFKKYKYRNIKYSQDYDFICRLLEDKCMIGNMGECLLYYRKPQIIDCEKRYIQSITHYCIQKLYKKSKLSVTDINQYVQEELFKNDKKKKRIIKSILLYDKALSELKQKRYCKAICYMFHSLFLSKYPMLEIKNTISYEIVK